MASSAGQRGLLEATRALHVGGAPGGAGERGVDLSSGAKRPRARCPTGGGPPQALPPHRRAPWSWCALETAEDAAAPVLCRTLTLVSSNLELETSPTHHLIFKSDIKHISDSPEGHGGLQCWPPSAPLLVGLCHRRSQLLSVPGSGAAGRLPAHLRTGAWSPGLEGEDPGGRHCPVHHPASDRPAPGGLGQVGVANGIHLPAHPQEGPQGE